MAPNGMSYNDGMVVKRSSVRLNHTQNPIWNGKHCHKELTWAPKSSHPSSFPSSSATHHSSPMVCRFSQNGQVWKSLKKRQNICQGRRKAACTQWQCNSLLTSIYAGDADDNASAEAVQAVCAGPVQNTGHSTTDPGNEGVILLHMHRRS